MLKKPSTFYFSENENRLARRLSIYGGKRHLESLFVFEAGSNSSIDRSSDERNDLSVRSQVGNVQHKVSASGKGLTCTLDDRSQEPGNPSVDSCTVTAPRLRSPRVPLSVKVGGRREDEVHVSGFEFFSGDRVHLSDHVNGTRQIPISFYSRLIDVGADVVHTGSGSTKQATAVAGARIPNATAPRTVAFVNEFCDSGTENRWRTAAHRDGSEDTFGGDRIVVIDLKLDRLLNLDRIVPSFNGRNVLSRSSSVPVRKEGCAESDADVGLRTDLAVIQMADDEFQSIEFASDFVCGYLRVREVARERMRKVLASLLQLEHAAIISIFAYGPCGGAFRNVKMLGGAGETGAVLAGIEQACDLFLQPDVAALHVIPVENVVHGLRRDLERGGDLANTVTGDVSSDDAVLVDRHLFLRSGHDDGGASRLSIENDRCVAIEQFHSSSSGAAVQIETENLFLPSRFGVQPDAVFAQEREKYVQYCASTTYADAHLIDFLCRDSDVAVTVDETSPEISRISENRRGDSQKAFCHSHSMNGECCSEFVGSYLETNSSMTLSSDFAPSRVDRMFGAEESSEFFQMCAVSLGDAHAENRGTASLSVDPSIGEEEANPVRGLWCYDVEGILPVRVLNSCLGTIAHDDAVTTKSVVHVICTDTKQLADESRRFASLVSCDRFKLLRFGEPDPTLGVVVHNVNSVCPSVTSCQAEDV